MGGNFDIDIMLAPLRSHLTDCRHFTKDVPHRNIK